MRSWRTNLARPAPSAERIATASHGGSPGPIGSEAVKAVTTRAPKLDCQSIREAAGAGRETASRPSDAPDLDQAGPRWDKEAVSAGHSRPPGTARCSCPYQAPWSGGPPRRPAAVCARAESSLARRDEAGPGCRPPLDVTASRRGGERPTRASSPEGTPGPGGPPHVAESATVAKGDTPVCGRAKTRQAQLLALPQVGCAAEAGGLWRPACTCEASIA